MLVLHGFWSPGRGLSLWAEDSERAVTSRSQALRAARPHPFAATTEVLAKIVPGTPGEATLQLPSLAKSPLDSPELVRVSPRAAARHDPVLLGWRVPTVELSPAGAVQWLGSMADDSVTPGSVTDGSVAGASTAGDSGIPTDQADIRPGASIAYLANVAAFAGELVERGRVVPTVALDDDGPVARWRPALRGPDVVALGALVAAMPPVCRSEPGRDAAYDLAADALRSLTDATMRARTGPDLDLVPPRRGRRPRQLPAVESWLAALTAADGHFDADYREVRDLERQLHPWAEIGTGRVGPARATFRLTEASEAPEASQADWLDDWTPPDEAPGQAPDESPADWRLEFLLQSTEDPSLLVPAAQAWTDDGSLRRWLNRPQELLLGELGRASRVYPELAVGLRQAKPQGLTLDAEGAFHFLSTAAPALDEAGFGVLLPSWWDRRARLGLKASASTPADTPVAKGRFGRDSLVDFQWQLAVGDDTLTAEEIAALAETKAPLVRLRGRWVAIDPEQLRRGLEFLTREPTRQRSAAEILALAARHPDDLDTPLPVTGVSADGWLGEVLSGAAGASLSTIEPPATFTAALRPYQSRGLSWLSFLADLGLGACLADDMGLGKTVQLLALESTHRADDPDAGPTLLLCPMSLVGNWQREAARFAPSLRVYAHHGSERLHGEALHEHLAATDLVLTTYGTGTRDMDELAEHDWHRVVLDEAQAIKNSQSRASRAVRRLRADHRIALTGTPVENRLSELWSIMDFVNPGILGSAELFRTRYAIPVERHGATEPAERLRTVTQPYVLRRLKTDPTIIDDLPEKIEIKEYCQLTVEQASLYQSIVDDMMDKIENSEGIARRGNVLATMAKLKQVCNHPA